MSKFMNVLENKSIIAGSWMAVVGVIGMFAWARASNSDYARNSRTKVVRSEAPVSPARVAAFAENYVKKINLLGDTTATVKGLGDKACKLQGFRPANLNSTRPNADYFMNIESRSKKEGYQFFVDKNKGKVALVSLGQYALDGCGKGVYVPSSAAQEVSFGYYHKNWSIQVDSVSPDGQESNKDYSTNTLNYREPLTKELFGIYTHEAEDILENAYYQEDLFRVQGFPKSSS